MLPFGLLVFGDPFHHGPLQVWPSSLWALCHWSRIWSMFFPFVLSKLGGLYLATRHALFVYMEAVCFKPIIAPKALQVL